MAINSTLANCNVGTLLDLSDVDTARKYLFTPLEDLFFTIVLPVVLGTCLIGNCAFLFTVFRVKSMSTVTNTYLSHVAMADIMFVTLSVVGYCHAYFQSPVRNDVQFRSFFGCMLQFLFVLTTYFVSLLLITFVTVERYYAICRPLEHRIVAGRSRTKKIIVACWTAGFFFGACVAPRYSGFEPHCVNWPENEEFQSLPLEIHPSVYLFSEMTQTAPLFLAMFANIFMYSRIITALGKRPTSTATSSDKITNIDQQQRVRNQVARLLIINGSLFFLCQSPFRIVSIHNMLVHEGRSGLFTPDQYGSMLVVGRCLIYINSCVNPFIYVITSSFYRHAFLKAINCGGDNSKHHCSTVSGKTNVSAENNRG